MSSSSAASVKQLRERTGAPMLDCKKALDAAGGDMELAFAELRKQGLAKANAKMGRIAAEGRIVIVRSADERSAVIVEINCETDFVARDETFKEFAQQVAETALYSPINDVSTLATQTLLGTNNTVDDTRKELIAKIGENIQIRRMEKITTDGVIGIYTHGARIGVIVAVKSEDETLAKDIAMHVAASRPLVVNREQVPDETIEIEREIFKAQARESGKPQEVIDKMIDGRINKYLDEVCLLGQPFVKDPAIKVGQLLNQANAEVTAFVRLEVGEGVEKKEDNFVEEVMSQLREQ